MVVCFYKIYYIKIYNKATIYVIELILTGKNLMQKPLEMYFQGI